MRYLCTVWILVSFCLQSQVILAGTGEEMVSAAHQFLASLSADQRAKITFEVKDTSREIWHFLPVADFGRFGLPLTELNDAQDQLVMNLLKKTLSTEGYAKAEQIIGLELVLKAMENNSPRRDPEQYHISIYGTPSLKGIWSWAFSGHHLSLHFTMVNGVIASTPTFLGANPAEVRQGDKKGLRVLVDEEEKALALLGSLDAQQRKSAVIADKAPYEIFTAAQSLANPLENKGITYRELEETQRKMLKEIVEEYIAIMPGEVAKIRKDRIEKAGWNDVYFAWAGVSDRSDGHYYRVQGPTFLIEFDNTQNDANHIHSVWRDFQGDFGRDLIKEHYRSSH